MSLPLICFDWDGTLADSMGMCVAHMAATFHEMGLPPFDPADRWKCNGPTYQESAALLGLPQARWAEFFAVRRRQELAAVNAYQKLFPGVAEMLAALKGRARLAIVSNGYPDYLALSLGKTGVRPFFDLVEGLKDGRGKSEALGEVLRRTAPPRAIMVGDREGDLAAGRANGLPTLAACYGYGSPREWASATRQAATVAELRSLLASFISGGIPD